MPRWVLFLALATGLALPARRAGASGEPSDIALRAEAARRLGQALAADGRVREGRAELERARALSDSACDVQGVAQADFAMGQVLWYVDRPESALRFRAALAGFEQRGDEVEQARALGPLLVADLADDGLEDLAESALTLARRRGDTPIEAKLLGNLAERKRRQGDFGLALDLLTQARALLEVDTGSAEFAAVLRQLAAVYMDHGNFTTALTFLRRVLSMDEKRHDPRAMTITLNLLGTDLELLGRLAEAEKEFRRAIALASKMNAPLFGSYARISLANLRIRQRRPRDAARILERLAGENPRPDVRGRVALALARAYVDLGRTSDAEPLLAEALDHPVRREDISVRVVALLVRSRLHRGQKKNEEALGDLREGLAWLERKSRQVYAWDQMLFEELVEQLYAAGRHEEALEAAEKARGRAFLDMLAFRRSSGPPETRTDARTATVAEVAETARRLRSTVVSYFVAESATYIWVVSPGGVVKTARVPAGAHRLAALVTEARGDDPGGPRRGGASVPAPDRTARGRRAWRSLHDALIAPVKGALPRRPGARITIVPHGPLVLLSFAALQGANERYLIEDYALHYVPTVALLSYTRPDEPGTLVVADPSPLPQDSRGDALPRLPGARREARTVTELRRGADVLAGRDATKRAIRERAGTVSVLHIATHALIFDDRPMDSFLAVSTSDGGDGMLTAREIHGLRLHADLVVLSSCRSALGTVSPDGVVGLTRAFLSAGASSVIAATRDVSDEIEPDLIRMLYEGTGRGEDKDRALREAQLHLMRRLRTGRVRLPGPLGPTSAGEDPSLWAGLVLVGEP